MSRVLVVDDAASNRKILTVLLTRAGHEVFSAGSVAEALESIRTAQPRAVLTDLRMENADDGLRLAREVRRLPGGKDLRLALMTGDAASFHDEEHLFETILEKPVMMADLLKFVKGEGK